MIWTWLAAVSTSSTLAYDTLALERMAAGSQGALAELYDRHARFVYSLALRIVRDPGDAEDVTQEVFVQAWVQAGRFDASRGPAIGWLLTMARARSIDLLRRRRSRPQLADAGDTFEAPDKTPGQDVQFEWTERASAIRQALGGLPGLQRVAIELAFFDGLTHAEIAEQLELPLGTVKTRVRQGLLRMRDQLAGAVS